MNLHTPRRHRSRFASILPLCLAAALGASSVAADAHAQGAGARPATPAPDAVKKATESFQEGVKSFQQKKFGVALELFKKSYDAVPSPNSHLYVARCQVEMGNLKEAFRTFEKVIAEAEQRGATEPKYLPTRDSAKVELDELSTKIATVSVNVQNADDSTRLKVGGAPVPREEWGKPIPFDPGSVEIVLESQGKPPVSQRVELKKGDKQVVDVAVPVPTGPVEPPPPPVEESSGELTLLPYALVAGGVGVVGMGMFAVAGSMSSSTYSELEELCGSGPCPTNQDELIDRGQTEQTLANVGLVVGAVGLAAGATILILDLAGIDDGGPAAKDTASVRVDAGPGYVGLSGSF